MFRRLLLILAVALWFGGFTFYAEVVIPTGHHVFHSEIRVGLLTQQVTRWLNLIALLPMGLIIWNTAASWSSATRWQRRLMVVCAGAFVIGEFLLFVIHPVMDRYISIESAEVTDETTFTRWHVVYESVATMQWVATIAYVWNALQVWRTRDKSQ